MRVIVGRNHYGRNKTTQYLRQEGGGGAYTNENAQDAVGGILTDSATVDFTYNDPANTITAVTKQNKSITSSAGGLELVNDAASPGNSKYYGTNVSGVKGFFSFPPDVIEITTAVYTVAVNTIYRVNSTASPCMVSLPATFALHAFVAVIGQSAGGWRIRQAASQQIFAQGKTVLGTSGYVNSGQPYDCVLLRCVEANNKFVIVEQVGNLVVV